MSTTKEDFTIGADPEFCCFKSGGDVVPADNYSERNCFGADGGGTAFEVRPDFSTNPLRVVSNIHKSLLQLVMKTPEFMDMEWQAGSWCETPGQPLGGHIHFGGLPRSPGVETCCNWLDQYVGSLSLLIENYEEGKHRRDDGYGLKSDYRTNDHGFEYRTCSSWLTSPYIAAAILCLAKATVHECANRKGKSAPRHVTHEHFKTMDVKTIKAKFGDIWSGVKAMELYPLYKPQIDLIAVLVANGRTWYPKGTMQKSWGIVNIDKIPGPVDRNPTLSDIWKGVLKVEKV